MHEAHDLSVDVHDERWEGLRWSKWTALEDATVAYRAEPPDEQGNYRLRCAGEAGLNYIGETGDRIRSRLRQLRKAMQYVEDGVREPGKPPHVAGGCVLAHVQAGRTVEVSWVATPSMDKRERRGIECELICAHRRAMDSNPTCQFAETLPSAD